MLFSLRTKENSRDGIQTWYSGKKSKKLLRFLQKEFGLTDLEAVKNSFCNSSKDIEQKINSMSYELKKAIRSDPQQIDNAVSVSEGKKMTWQKSVKSSSQI